MTTGDNPPGDNPLNDPNGADSPSWSQQGQEPYPGQAYGQQGQEPYPGQAYGQQNHQFGATAAATTGRVSAPDVVTAAWQLFKNNPLPWILMTVAVGISNGLSQLVSNFTSPAVSTIGSLVFVVVGLVIQAFMIRGALLEVDGHKPDIEAFFKFHNFGWFILANIILGLIAGIPLIIGVAIFITAVIAGGTALIAFIGFLVMIPFAVLTVAVGFFLYWTLNFVVDRNMTAIAAIKSSFNAIKSDAKNLFLLALLNTAILIVGSIPLLLGLLVAYPVVVLASMIAYRAITGPSDFSRTATSAL